MSLSRNRKPGKAWPSHVITALQPQDLKLRRLEDDALAEGLRGIHPTGQDFREVFGPFGV